jgi:hypothetical protein
MAAPDLKKTKLCSRYFQGLCTDADCKFAHGYEELRGMDGLYKTGLCHGWQAGNCRFGKSCRFAHGAEELQTESPMAVPAVKQPMITAKIELKSAPLSSMRWSEVESDDECDDTSTPSTCDKADCLSSTACDSSDESSSSPGSDSVVDTEETRTTIKIAGFPKSFTRAQLLELLDDAGFLCAYDFVYLPCDLQSLRECLGYGFVNFTMPEAAMRAKLHLEAMERGLEVSWSNNQGLEVQLQRLTGSTVLHETVADEAKPALFRQGIRIAFPESMMLPEEPRRRRATKLSRMARRRNVA